MADVEKNGDTAPPGSAAGMKVFLIALLVLDLLAGGVYGWLALAQRNKAQAEKAAAQRNLTKVKEQSEAVATAVDRIGRENQQKVSVLSDLVNIVASRIPLEVGGSMKDLITTSKGRSGRFGTFKAWNEDTCDVRFLEKEGYKFHDLINFMQKIEAANPMVQIKEVNFGPRDDGEEIWRPLSMTVRVFTPAEKK